MDTSPIHDGSILVLGGGALRGLAHIGVLRALEERRIRIAGIVGTSVGAIVGAAYASGRTVDELEAAALVLERSDITRVNRRTLFWLGLRQEALLQAEPLREFIGRLLGPATYDSLEIPLRVNAVSLDTGSEHWFGAGVREDLPLCDAVYASAALPLVYPPLPVEGDRLVDGALAGNPAVHGAKGWGRSLIVSDVQADFPAPPDPALHGGLIEIHTRVAAILSQPHDRRERELAAGGVWIRPDVGAVSSFDFDGVGALIQAGYAAAVEALNEAQAEPAPRPWYRRLADLLRTQVA